MTAGNPVVALEGVSKRFGSTQALNNVDIVVRVGELVGLIGHNGAGKSSAMKIIAGEYHPDSGTVRIRGADRTAEMSPATALKLGVRCVNQELDLPGNLRVREAPIYAVPAAIGRGAGWQMRAELRMMGLLDTIFPNSGISPWSRIERLTISQRQMLAIALVGLWADSETATCLVLDEPTSSLDTASAKRLYDWLRLEARSRNLGVLVSTHKLNEVIGELDRVYVMADGAVVSEREMAGAARDELVASMKTSRVRGASAISSVPAASGDNSSARSRAGSIRVRNLQRDALRIESFDVASGEIVGLGGLEGQGQKTLLRAIFDASKGSASRPWITVVGRSAFVSGDRSVEGIFPLWNVERNVSISTLNRLTRFGIVSDRLERKLAGRWHSALGIKGRVEDRITSLSGGTQQKALVGRALAQAPDVLLLDDPTRGVDEETKLEISAIIRAQADQGTAVVWYSTETVELHRCCRVAIMLGGAISNTMSSCGLSERELEDRVLSSSFS